MKFSKFAVMGAFALVAASLGGVPASASSPTKVVEISFDGFCDGMAINIPSAGVGTRSTVDGPTTGCEMTAFFGQTGPRDARPARIDNLSGVARGTAYITNPTYSLMYVVHPDQTFKIYGLDGDMIGELLSGTWSYGPPALAGPSAKSTAEAAGEAVSGSPRTAKVSVPTLELTFDGFCDGMKLVSPSVGTGVKGTVDGTTLGCESSGLFGALTKIDGQKRTYVVEWINSVGTVIQSAIYPDHTYIHYAQDGTTITIAGSGTWTEGPPPGANQSSVSSSAR